MLTREELAEELARTFTPEAELPVIVRPEEEGETTAAGAVTIDVYTVPAGYDFSLTRLIIEAAGFTPAAPFTGAGAYIAVRRSSVLIDFASLIAVEPSGGGKSLPALFTYSVTSGFSLRNKEVLQVELVAGPASTRILARAEGFLRRGK